MIDPDIAARLASSTAERLLGCSVITLANIGPRGCQGADRIGLLLEWIVGVARASHGVVLLADDAGHLAVRAARGIPGDSPRLLRGRLDAVTFGLIVHGAAIGDTACTPREGACEHAVVDVEARTVLSLPLGPAERPFGLVQLGFADLRSLEPSELRRLGMIADHIAAVAEAERLAEERAARLADVARLEGAVRDLEQMKGDFLSMISHELRTPLTAIIGYTDLLLRQVHGRLNGRQAQHQQAVKKAAHRLLALINDLLDLNRLERGHLVLNFEDVLVMDVVEAAAAQVRPSAEQRQVTMHLDAPPSPLAVRADRERLQQVVVNLLDNAVKFTRGGGLVTVRVEQRDGQVTVSVADTGIGVPPDQVERIWDRFHQADSSTRRQFGGTGLGLAIVRQLVELHGGNVAVASAGPNLGSTFSFTLPAVDPATATAPAAPAEPSKQPAPGSARHILVVDDEPDNRAVITSIVHDVLGHAVTTAASGPEALRRARQRPDLVLLDLRMPGMSGFEVARTLKRDPMTAQIPVVAITALDDEDDRREAIAAGCVGCVTKPFSEEALAAAVSSLLASEPARTSR